MSYTVPSGEPLRFGSKAAITPIDSFNLLDEADEVCEQFLTLYSSADGTERHENIWRHSSLVPCLIPPLRLIPACLFLLATPDPCHFATSSLDAPGLLKACEHYVLQQRSHWHHLRTSLAHPIDYLQRLPHARHLTILG